ncbi:hypothetical protein ccbrp13_27650 [Ktedonobacteria bacterium brp13]|nr:hypothetical protein ccbrp13_27650 [Ktedonobacteria bacterium brp13]
MAKLYTSYSSAYKELKPLRGAPGRFVTRPHATIQASDLPAKPITLRASTHPEAVAKVSSRYSRISNQVGDLTQRPTVPQLQASPSPVRPFNPMTPIPSMSDMVPLNAVHSVLHPVHHPAQLPTVKRSFSSSHQALALARPVVRAQPRDIGEINTFPPLLSNTPAVRRGLWRPLDALRWWLLAPGRLEIIIWIIGVIILLIVTALLVWFFAVSWRYCLF